MFSDVFSVHFHILTFHFLRKLIPYFMCSHSVESEGFFKPSIPHTVMRVTEIIVLHAIGFYLLFNGQIAAGLGENIQHEQVFMSIFTARLYSV